GGDALRVAVPPAHGAGGRGGAAVRARGPGRGRARLARRAHGGPARQQAAVKESLKAGLTLSKTVEVDESRCIGFMGKEGAVYATPRMVSDVEYACRDFLLQHLDPGEDSVGAHVSIDHLAATPLGLQVTIEAKVGEVDRRKVPLEFWVRDPGDPWGRGRHVRFVVETAKSRERLGAKRAKTGL